MALRAPLVRASAWLVGRPPERRLADVRAAGQFSHPKIAHWDHEMMIH